MYTHTESKCLLMDEQINKMCCASVHICIHTLKYFPVIKKNEIIPFSTMWSQLEDIMLSEVSQTGKDILYDLP